MVHRNWIRTLVLAMLILSPPAWAARELTSGERFFKGLHSRTCRSVQAALASRSGIAEFNFDFSPTFFGDKRVLTIKIEKNPRQKTAEMTFSVGNSFFERLQYGEQSSANGFVCDEDFMVCAQVVKSIEKRLKTALKRSPKSPQVLECIWMLLDLL